MSFKLSRVLLYSARRDAKRTGCGAVKDGTGRIVGLAFPASTETRRGGIYLGPVDYVGNAANARFAFWSFNGWITDPVKLGWSVKARRDNVIWSRAARLRNEPKINALTHAELTA